MGRISFTQELKELAQELKEPTKARDGMAAGGEAGRQRGGAAR